MAQDPWATATSYGVASGSGAFSNSVNESLAQLEALWIAAGGDPTTAPTAAGIAYAESYGGNPTAYNATQSTGDQSFGLWQINTAAHPEYKGQVTAQDATSIFNPVQNAEDAVSIYKKQGFSAWSTYGGAKQQAETANAPAPTSAAVTNATPTPAPATPLQAIPGNVAGAVGNAVSGAANAAGNAVSNAVGGAASGAIGTLQTSWANFWTAHPATLIVAGIVLLVLAWALVASSAPQTTLVTTVGSAASNTASGARAVSGGARRVGQAIAPVLRAT